MTNLMVSRAKAPAKIASRFELVELIATGGMGSVHLARTIGTRPTAVAVKLMHPELADDPAMMASFLDEARIASRVAHPNVLRVHDIYMATTNELAIVMEYIEGTTLQRVLRKLAAQRACVEIGVGLRIIHDVLEGLHAAHELRGEDGKPAGVVHRDVSPQNVLVGSDGWTKVSDFGIAMAAGRLATTTTSNGSVKGKLRYLAPEQVLRRPLDRRVDVFASGILLWETLTGRSLFDAGTQAETLAMILKGTISTPGEHRPEIPVSLDEICLRALEREPDARFPTARDFADALQANVGHLFAPREAVGALISELVGDELASRREALADTSHTSSLRGRSSDAKEARAIDLAGGTKTVQDVVPEPRRAKKAIVLASAAIFGVVTLPLIWLAKPSHESAPPMAAPSIPATVDPEEESSARTLRAADPPTAVVVPHDETPTAPAPESPHRTRPPHKGSAAAAAKSPRPHASESVFMPERP